MSVPSFTVQNYASTNWSVTFDIVHTDGTELSREETATVQSSDHAVRREIFANFCDSFDNISGDEKVWFDVRFMTANDGKPHYWSYFGINTAMGGYFELYFEHIKTIPCMINLLNTLTTEIQKASSSYALKIVHLNIGTVWFSKDPVAEHELELYKGYTKNCIKQA